MADATEVFEDLRAEGEELDRLVAELPEERWRRPTPAPGWTIAHQIGHLLWTDEAALLAVRDEEAFRRAAEQALAVSGEAVSGEAVDTGAESYAALPPAELLRRWRDARGRLGRELAGLPDGRRVPWFAADG
ncbi:maleylpyruvate isomerase N-terminal domain-containing protein, partial [Streptomyces oceani]|uniref:maleylpyruvate isomerase N-terminal domain-containing protein n=1 Tax=Streptomyces oceani TaxID=1075402 RepID=UPI001112F6E3